jgi:SAM-dependent methyltransferase
MIGQWIVSRLENKRNDVVKSHVKGRLLDVGCGYNVLVKSYGDGIGVDVYPWPGVDRVIENAAELPFPDASFDTISFVACLNHIPNRKEALAEAARVVKPEGRVLATMIPPTISRIWHRVILQHDADQTERGMKEGEVWGLTTQQIVSIASEAGLAMEKVVPFELGLNHLYVMKPKG